MSTMNLYCLSVLVISRCMITNSLPNTASSSGDGSRVRSWDAGNGVTIEQIPSYSYSYAEGSAANGAVDGNQDITSFNQPNYNDNSNLYSKAISSSSNSVYNVATNSNYYRQPSPSNNYINTAPDVYKSTTDDAKSSNSFYYNPNFSYQGLNTLPDNQINYQNAQSRFHPTTFEVEDEHTGEVVLPPASDNKPVASQINEVVVSPPLSQGVGATSFRGNSGSFPNNQGSFGSDLSAQGSDSSFQVDSLPAADQVLSYHAPSLPSGYDYHPPAPYYYPPPPSNQYLPVPPPPLPPPPPPPPTTPPQVTYYYLGSKLWHVPLLFSAYFVMYVAALIVKAVARHKINFPQNLFTAANGVFSNRNMEAEDLSRAVIRQLSKAALKYIGESS